MMVMNHQMVGVVDGIGEHCEKYKGWHWVVDVSNIICKNQTNFTNIFFFFWGGGGSLKAIY